MCKTAVWEKTMGYKQVVIKYGYFFIQIGYENHRDAGGTSTFQLCMFLF